MQIIKTLSMITALLSYTTAAGGTNIHANDGCWQVLSPNTADYQRVCQGLGALPYPSGYATFIGGFNGDGGDSYAFGTCTMTAVWDPSYGDIYLRENGCLYDAQSNCIGSTCCSNPGAYALNPYYNY
ncbi:hypothetical protein GGI43DRAFT_433241 [Trichoderma evansii]